MAENKDLALLEELNKKLSAPLSPEAENARIEDPVEAIEESLGTFVKDSFECVRESRSLERAIDAAIEARMPEANFSQLIDLKDKVQRNNIAATSGLINPLIPAIIVRKEEAEAAAAGGPADEIVYKKASKDVLQGLTALNQLLSVATKIASDNKVIIAEAHPSE